MVGEEFYANDRGRCNKIPFLILFSDPLADLLCTFPVKNVVICRYFGKKAAFFAGFILLYRVTKESMFTPEVILNTLC